MGVGRFFCVALPFILSVASMAFLMASTLAGITAKDLYLFRIDASELEISPGDILDLLRGSGWEDLLPEGVNIEDLDLDNLPDNINPDNIPDDINPDDLPDIPDNVNPSDVINNNKKKRQNNPTERTITAEDLGLDDVYYINIWNYCSIDADGDRSCIDSAFDWAREELNTGFLQTAGEISGNRIELPEEMETALDIFKEVSRWTQIVYLIAFGALGLSIVCGIFANFTRVMSCITWFVAVIATVAVVGVAAMTTTMAVVAVGAIRSAAELSGVSGVEADLNTTFLALVWIAAACALAAGFFWLFTICCCAPDRSSSRERRGSSDYSDKYFPPGAAAGTYNNSGTYQPLPSPEHQGFYNQQTTTQYGAPRHPAAVRSDMAYEPYSHRV
ncbi:hypothetical protein SODALDRAFT_331776 [Sodiomyces alkalinus F11]|uniref:Integral membrane protein n=1 Tax=Sodiomyces alkalinus (strain CBS 110278 / VKM F-3762 / F11) TaxID=1314773 RepID=A0A3N2PYV5_SODAK|nr:hypothetical protein SODALDRAFT_331776 [Sodiomyces alkalinus F11]ROT39672.1 hypothetical protein SODALDRAFT_331776 [Sodiomyces alkalinus F11]